MKNEEKIAEKIKRKKTLKNEETKIKIETIEKNEKKTQKIIKKWRNKNNKKG